MIKKIIGRTAVVASMVVLAIALFASGAMAHGQGMQGMSSSHQCPMMSKGAGQMSMSGTNQLEQNHVQMMQQMRPGMGLMQMQQMHKSHHG